MITLDEAIERLEAITAPEGGKPMSGTAHINEGHPYVDHPSTLCIKRRVGATEIMWTFRGTNDDEVWSRAAQQIRHIDEASKSYAPPQQAPAAQGAATARAPAARVPYADTAAGPVPICPVHRSMLKPSKFVEGELYCTAKNSDGTYCKVTA
jgi:hypothetical protein